MCVLAGLIALIVGAYLSVLTFPSTHAAPTIRNSMSSSRERGVPKWLNPCGMGGVNGAASDHRMPDIKLIEQIVNQAQIAESRARTFKEDFVSTFLRKWIALIRP